MQWNQSCQYKPNLQHLVCSPIIQQNRPQTWCILERASLWQLKNKSQLEATYCFIILMISWTCFGPCYAHHQVLTTIVLIPHWSSRSWVAVGWKLGAGRLEAIGAIACSADTYPACLNLTSNQQQPKNRMVHVVISTIVVSSWWWA